MNIALHGPIDKQINHATLEFGHNALLQEITQNGANLPASTKWFQNSAKICLVLHHFSDIINPQNARLNIRPDPGFPVLQAGETKHMVKLVLFIVPLA